MELELVTIGTELLLGFTLDTNSAFLGQALAEVGIRLRRRTSVPDEEDAVVAAVGEALARSGFVITTGGLGPTRDDLSKHAVARLFGVPLEFHPEIWQSITTRFARLGRQLSERNRCQAEVPRGATVLPNPRGTAPGLWLSAAAGEVIMLPGVPAEMRGLVREEVLPRLAARAGGKVVRSLLLRTTGIAESALADRLEPVEETLAPLSLAYLPSLDGVDLRLTAWNSDSATASPALEAAGARLRERIPEHLYGVGDTDLAAVVLDECRRQRLSLAVAESCTGGMLGTRLTAIPGSSDVFTGGLIAYANSIKQELGVPERILEEQGAVSEATVLQMAERTRERFGVGLAVAVSGIAGPGGGSPEKPVGLVWFGIADEQGSASHQLIFPGTRHEIRARATQYALWRLWRRVGAGAPGGMPPTRL